VPVIINYTQCYVNIFFRFVNYSALEFGTDDNEIKFKTDV